MDKKKNIVIFGGANGTSLVVRALKQFTDKYNISAVVSMSDSGRSSAKIREEIEALPTADVLRVLCAMSSYDYNFLREILYSNRLDSHPRLNSFNIGTLFMGLAGKYCDDNIVAVIRGMQNVLKCVGNVYPATLEMTDLNVELDDGSVICGEGLIDDPEGSRDRIIKRAWLDPDGELYEGARKVIESADVIITGPGDLYTSNIASLLARGTKEAIGKTNALIIYIAGNKYALEGEFAPIKLSERVKALEEYLPRSVDHIVYDGHKLIKSQEKLYAEKKWGLVECDMRADPRVLVEDFERQGGGLSSIKLGNILCGLIR